MVGCMVSVGDIADRDPRALADGELLDIGGHTFRWLDTPHVPHAWEAGLLYDTTTRTLFCGDLFARWGPFPAITVDDIVAPALAEDDPSWSLAPSTPATIRRLADLEITALAPMHGPAYTGDCTGALTDLAAGIERIIARTAPSTSTSTPTST
jgi:flavorubredoxin